MSVLHASHDMPRVMGKCPPRWRRRCACGERETHTGCVVTEDGTRVALMSGCQWCVRQWIRDPSWRYGGEA